MPRPVRVGRRFLTFSALATIGLVAAGCAYPLAVGAGLSVLFQSKSSKNSQIPQPVSVTTPIGLAFDRVPINYVLKDGSSTPFDLRVEYSLDGASGQFNAATEALGAPSQGTQNLSSSQAGNPHVFVWNSFADLDTRNVVHSTNVVVRVSALIAAVGSNTTGTGGVFGQAAETGPFTIDNRLIATVAGPPTTVGEDIPATQVSLNSPDIAIVGSGGDILVADTTGARIRRVDATTKLVATAAGSGVAGFGGDGGRAVASNMLQPKGVAILSGGDMVICDTGNNRIRRVAVATGIITTIAGTGAAGFGGDGGPATAAVLSAPTGVVVGANDDIFFTDTNNHVVRRITAAGTVTTVAGTGTAGAAGDGGPATGAQLSSPHGLSIDTTGTIYVADAGNHAVRAFAVGGSLTTIAGTLGVAGRGAEKVAALGSALSSPQGVCVIGGGDIFVCDTANNRIRSFTLGGKIETVAGALDGTAGFAGDGGPASASLLSEPVGIASDGAGGVLFADRSNERIRQLTAGGLIETVVGSGAPDAQNFGDGDLATNAQFKDTAQLARGPDGSIYVADEFGHRVRRFTIGGTMSTIAGIGLPGFSGDGGPATRAQLNQPWGIAVDQNGIIFISDNTNVRIRSINQAGIINTVMGGGTGPDGVATLTSIGGCQALYSRRGLNELLVSDGVDATVRRLTYTVDSSGNVLTGTTDTIAGVSGSPGFSGDGGPATSAQLSACFGMGESATGDIYLLDQFANVLRKFTIGGNINTIAGDSVNATAGFAGDGGPAINCLMSAYYMAVDPNTFDIYITDFFNNRVRKMQDGGNINTIAGNGDTGDAGIGGPALQANTPLTAGIVVQPDSSIVFACSGTKRVYMIGSDGLLQCVAGRAGTANRGDGGSAVAATLFQPMPVVTPDGTLYVAELDFARIRRVDRNTGIITNLVGKSILGQKGYGGPLSGIFIDAVTGICCDKTGSSLYIGEINQSIVSQVDLVHQTVNVAVGTVPGSVSGGDGGPALQATLQQPEGVCISPQTGALYFTDSLVGLVRRVDPLTTIITTVAGGGSTSADNVPATSAILTQPAAIACDANENLYVANRNPEATVRKFTVGGNIVTVAGIQFSNGYNGDDLPATSAQLNNPQGLVVDAAGNVYISDSLNNRVRRLDPQGFITTVAGTGENGSGPDGVPATQSKLSGPRGIALDAKGNIYVGEEFGNRVRRFRIFP